MLRIDLHGVKHEDVRSLLVSEIERLWGSQELLEIITGNSAVMTGIVSEVLIEYGLKPNVGGLLGTKSGTVFVDLTES